MKQSASDYAENRYLALAVSRYYDTQDTEALYALLQLLAERIGEDGCVPCPGSSSDSWFSLQDGQGNRYLPLFTDEAELQRQPLPPGFQVTPTPIRKILSAALQQDTIIGVIVNPYGQSMALTRELLEYFMENLCPAEEATEPQVMSYPEPGTVLTPELEKAMTALLERYLVLLELTAEDDSLAGWCEAYPQDTRQHEALVKLIQEFAGTAEGSGLCIPEYAQILLRDQIDRDFIYALDARSASLLNREQLLALIAGMLQLEKLEPGSLIHEFGSGRLLLLARAWLNL